MGEAADTFLEDAGHGAPAFELLRLDVAGSGQPRQIPGLRIAGEKQVHVDEPVFGRWAAISQCFVTSIEVASGLAVVTLSPQRLVVLFVDGCFLDCRLGKGAALLVSLAYTDVSAVEPMMRRGLFGPKHGRTAVWYERHRPGALVTEVIRELPPEGGSRRTNDQGGFCRAVVGAVSAVTPLEGPLVDPDGSTEYRPRATPPAHTEPVRSQPVQMAPPPVPESAPAAAPHPPRPPATPQPRATGMRNVALASVAGLVAGLVLAIAVLPAVSRSEPSSASPATATTTTVATVPPQTQAPATTAKPIRGPTTLTHEGFGPVRVGMTLVEAERALGRDLTAEWDWGDTSCGHMWLNNSVVSSIEGPEAVIRTVETGESGVASTDRGIRFGSSEHDVVAAYGAVGIQRSEHELAEGVSYLDVVFPDDLALRFLVAEGRVTRISGGVRSWTRLVEGCA